MDDNLRTFGESTTIILYLVFIPFLQFDVLMHSTLKQDCIGFFFWIMYTFCDYVYVFTHIYICVHIFTFWHVYIPIYLCIYVQIYTYI